MNYGKEFRDYGVKHLGLNGTTLDSVVNHQIDASYSNPMVIEEREMRVTQIDVFSRLMIDRILWISGTIESRMASIVQAQLMFLDSVNKKDITIHVDSGGGSCLSGLGIRDVMNYIVSDCPTINTGMCASMGSILLSSGTKGKRSSLIHSKVMTHTVSHGSNGKIAETRISQMEAEKYNYVLFKILAENCGKTFDEIFEISRNDKWFNSSEALEIGLVDEIIGLDNNQSITTMFEGFDEYYKKEVMGKSI